MGRPSRQSRRAQQRRQQRRAPAQKGPNWSLITAGGVVAAAIILFIIFIVTGAGNKVAANNATPTPLPTIPPGPKVAGIGCDQGMSTTYHVHAYFAVYRNGKAFNLDGTNIGHDYNSDCLYWLHTHPQDTGNVIHIEAPAVIKPTLSQYLSVMKATVGASKTPSISPPAGQKREVWLNGKLHSGNPLDIKLKRHEQIVIELGKPFFKPKPFQFGSL